MKKEGFVKGNYLIIVLSFLLLGLVYIFYAGFSQKRSVLESLDNKIVPLSDEQLENIGKGLDLSTLAKPLSDKQLDNIGKGLDPKTLPTPLTDEQLDQLGR